MPSGYQECPDRDPRPTTWSVMLDLALLATVVGTILICGTH